MPTRELILDLVEKREGNALVQAARDLEQLAKGADVTGDKFAHAASDIEKLDMQIVATKEHVQDLQVQFARTGDTQLFGDIRKEQSLLRNLEKVREGIANAAEAGLSAGLTAGLGGGGKGLAGLTTGIGPPIMAGVIGGLATAAVLGAPTLGAMIAGVVAGAIGTGGIAGGILMAVTDPHVKAAAGEFKDTIADQFFGGGSQFVGPVIQSLNFLERAFQGLNFGNTFAKTADEVYTIAHGIGDLAYNLMPGLNNAFDHMDPFADAAAEGLAETGAALGDFMDSVTASPGAVMGLEAAFNLINNTIRVTGGFIEWLSDGFERFVNILQVVTGVIMNLPFVPKSLRDDLAGVQRELADLEQHGLGFKNGLDDGTHVMESFGLAADNAAAATRLFDEALDDSYSTFLKFTGAEISAEAAIDELQESFEKNGTTLDVHTEAGRKNLQNLKDLADASAEAAKAKYIETGSVVEANAVYDSYRQQLYDTLIGLGKTAEEAQVLTDKWLGLKQLEDIVKNVTINQRTYRTTYGPDPGTSWGGGFQEFDQGGMVQGQLGSAQMVIAHAGERVQTRAQQAADLARSTSSGGSTNLTVSYQPSGNGLIDAILAGIRIEVSKVGPGVIGLAA